MDKGGAQRTTGLAVTSWATDLVLMGPSSGSKMGGPGGCREGAPGVAAPGLVLEAGWKQNPSSWAPAPSPRLLLACGIGHIMVHLSTRVGACLAGHAVPWTLELELFDIPCPIFPVSPAPLFPKPVPLPPEASPHLCHSSDLCSTCLAHVLGLCPVSADQPQCDLSPGSQCCSELDVPQCRLAEIAPPRGFLRSPN